MQEGDLQKLKDSITDRDSESCQNNANELVNTYGATKVLESAVDKDYNGEFKVAYYLANAAIEKSTDLNDNDKAAAHYIAGKTSEELGDKDKANDHYEEAKKLYDGYIGNNTDEPAGYFNYAMLLEKMGKVEEAKTNYKKAIELKPYDAKALAKTHNNYAIFLANQNDNCSAKEHYQKAIELDPNNYNAHNNYANMLNKSGHKFEAECHFKDAIKINSNYFAARYNYAYLLKDLGRFYEAEEQARIAIKLRPNDPLALSALGAILKDKGDLIEAEIALKEALNNSVSICTKRDEKLESRIHTYLGSVYTQEGRDTVAEREFQEALRLNSKNESAETNLANLRKAEVISNISYVQIIISGILLILLAFDYYLLISGYISDSIFAAQSTTIIVLTIVVLFIQYISHLEVGSQGFKFDLKDPEPPAIR